MRDANDQYLGDDVGVFLQLVKTNNDTRGPTHFIREQHEITGAATNGKADHLSDRGHVVKCDNNMMFNLREKERSLKGAHGLTNMIIKSINSDCSAVI